MKRILIAAIALMCIGGCSAQEQHRQQEDFHERYVEGGTTAASSDEAMPYGSNYQQLTNQTPDVVAETALNKLGQFTAQEFAHQEVVSRLNGVVTPELWMKMNNDPSQIVPFLTGPVYRAWNDAGGTQVAVVRKDGEQQPPDTENTWARKYSVTRTMDGITADVNDTYIIECKKISGQWRVSDLRLLSTVAQDIFD